MAPPWLLARLDMDINVANAKRTELIAIGTDLMREERRRWRTWKDFKPAAGCDMPTPLVLKAKASPAHPTPSILSMGPGHPDPSLLLARILTSIS